MRKKINLSDRKEPTQRRSIELRNAILQAATYILKEDGPQEFTTNKVAERAGVNIASFYQYYPNKESLLFHLAEIEWEQTFNAVFPILEDKSKTHGERLKIFIEKFYETESEEIDLKQAMGAIGILIENTPEYKKLMKKADVIFMKFLSDSLRCSSQLEFKKKSQFIYQIIFSYSECLQDKKWVDVKSDANMMSTMLCEHFDII